MCCMDLSFLDGGENICALMDRGGVRQPHGRRHRAGERQRNGQQDGRWMCPQSLRL